MYQVLPAYKIWIQWKKWPWKIWRALTNHFCRSGVGGAGEKVKCFFSVCMWALSTAVLLTGGLGGVAAAGGKMVVESLIPSTQTVEQKEKSIGENISASIASAPVLGYGNWINAYF